MSKINVAVGDPVTIINEVGETETGYTMTDPKYDKHGMVIIKRGEATLHIHPKRIVIGEVKLQGTLPGTKKMEIPMANKPQPIKKEKVVPQKVDIGAIAAQGELWVRSGIDFDGQTEVNTYCLLAPPQGRYLSFNTYDGTFGKKNKQPPIQDLLDGKEVGYPAKDVEKLRIKLTKGGYKKY